MVGCAFLILPYTVSHIWYLWYTIPYGMADMGRSGMPHNTISNPPMVDTSWYCLVAPSIMMCWIWKTDVDHFSGTSWMRYRHPVSYGLSGMVAPYVSVPTFQVPYWHMIHHGNHTPVLSFHAISGVAVVPPIPSTILVSGMGTSQMVYHPTFTI